MNSRQLIVFGFAALILPCIAWGQLPQHDKYEHLGVQSCGASSCHGSASVRNTYSVLQNEYITWARHDLHARAYSVLKNEQSQRIADNLGLESAHTAKICLDCHSDNVPSDRRGLQFQLSDGVACEACHGGAEHWLGIHISGGGDKHAETLAAGLYPTENPEARAELCLSCHLGTQDKFATHEIMGAGHPRLSFDLQKFTDIQPRHYRIDEDYRARKDYVEDTRAWAIGQVKASRQYMSLLQGPRMTGTGIFPELGLFDCHACHHAFTDYRWQANERSTTPPGTVLLNDSSLAMSHIIASVVQPGTANSMLSAIRELHLASQTSVTVLRTAAMALDRQLGQLADKLKEMEFGQQENRQMISALSNAVGKASFSDYSDAEQATMALDVFSGVTGQYKNEMDALYQVVADVEVTSAKRFDPKMFAAVFNSSLGYSATPAKQPPERVAQQPAPVTRAPDRTVQRPAPTPKPVAVARAPAQRPVAATPAPAPSHANLAVTHVVKSNALRVRSKPEATAGVRGLIYFGHAVQLMNNTGEWSQVSYIDTEGVVRTGWVASSLIVEKSAAVSTPPVRPVASAPPPSSPDTISPTHVVNTGALRVRYQPDSSAAVRSIVYRGAEVQLLDDTGEWSQIAYFDSDHVARKGWVGSSLIVEQSTGTRSAPRQTSPRAVVAPPREISADKPIGKVVPTHVVNANALRVRYTPEDDGGVVGTLYYGDEVQLVDASGNWSRIVYVDSIGTRRGWIATSFLDPM